MTSTHQKPDLGELFTALRSQSGGELPANLSFEQAQEIFETFLRNAGADSPFAAAREETLRMLKATLPSRAEQATPQARKKQRLIQAAAELFASTGYRKTSIDDIARRAHVAKGTVYLYFENKAQLLLQAILQEKTRYATKVTPLMRPGLAPAETLRTWLRVFFAGLDEMPIVARLMSGDREIMIALEELGGALDMNVVGIQNDLLAQMIDHAAASRRYTEGELRDRAQILMALLYAATQIFDERLRGGIPRERFAAAFADVIVDGLVGHPEVTR